MAIMQIHEHSLSWVGRSIKRGGVISLIWAHASHLSEMMRYVTKYDDDALGLNIILYQTIDKYLMRSLLLQIVLLSTLIYGMVSAYILRENYVLHCAFPWSYLRDYNRWWPYPGTTEALQCWECCWHGSESFEQIHVFPAQTYILYNV